MTKRNILKILEVQRIDEKLVEAGFSRNWIFTEIIELNYHISQRTYYNYLDINARKALWDQYGLDWKKEVFKSRINPLQIIKELDQKTLFDVEPSTLSDDQRREAIKNLKR